MRLVDYYEDQAENKYYFVSELCKGNDLFELLKAKGRMEERQAGIIIKQLLSALKYCHSKNICHRDIKVENIVVDEDN